MNIPAPDLYKKQFLLLFLFLPAFVSAQVLEGKVLSAKDSTALQGVSIYFDGTSIGTSTNASGNFSLEAEAAIEIPLIISFLGYETKVITNLTAADQKLPIIYLKEKPQELAEVIISPDPWSREKKLRIFRREFLGNSPEAQKVKIKNEEVLKLKYNPIDEVLTVDANEPLVIINRFLGYKIRYNLHSFRVEFSRSPMGLRLTRRVYYEGLSFFEELRKRGRRKFLQNRESSYYGSSLHFMRSLSQQKLHENDFRIFHNKFEVPPYKFFDLEVTPRGVEANLLSENLSILYKGIEQSGISTKEAFLIDALGNHSPPLHVIFSGEMGSSRIAHLLPLDYQP